ncbi:GNAT family N-acetyltransferase [Jeotgalibacillus sp. ET6]|uniref:GNAT family N-acetyltransferase n=1 Tax=Jeotgalibacillus sp. ET6 TaxID=3037260 RepID=UPI0024181A34|nr:GNAT family N-acetyltransferase [Jeotgalibacillus sp. ET6]MDG5472302.1 GNAT family N-acetyltransferase [Jeotgalibacillus sp. ET6]
MQKIVQQGEDQTLRSRLLAFQQFDRNSMKAETGQFGSAICFKAGGIPGPSFNKVRHLTAENNLEDIEAWFGTTSFQIELTPDEATSDVFRLLRQHEFFQSGFHASFMGLSKEAAEAKQENSISIQQLGNDEFEDFAQVYVKSFGLPDSIKEGVRHNNECLANIDGWYFLKALDGEHIAGVAALYVEKNVAVLASSAVLPSFRGRGIQRALIQKRAELAKKAGAAYITSEAAFSSASHKNMIRCGLNLVYTKALYDKVT